MVSTAESAPAMRPPLLSGTPPSRHWYERFEPVAATVKVVGWVVYAAWGWGCWTMTGAGPTTVQRAILEDGLASAVSKTPPTHRARPPGAVATGAGGVPHPISP